jgi:hypothetical protein
MTPALRRDAERAMQVLARDGRRLSGGRAVLFVLEEVGWRPLLIRIASMRPFVWLVEGGYRVVAGHRQVFSRIFFRRRL